MVDENRPFSTFYYLLTLVSFVRIAYATKKALLRVGEIVFLFKDDKSLVYTRWNCKYHVIFTSKYRRKEILGKSKISIGQILNKCVR